MFSFFKPLTQLVTLGFAPAESRKFLEPNETTSPLIEGISCSIVVLQSRFTFLKKKILYCLSFSSRVAFIVGQEQLLCCHLLVV